jgi:hypothetical protein
MKMPKTLIIHLHKPRARRVKSSCIIDAPHRGLNAILSVDKMVFNVLRYKPAS